MRRAMPSSLRSNETIVPMSKDRPRKWMLSAAGQPHRVCMNLPIGLALTSVLTSQT